MLGHVRFSRWSLADGLRLTPAPLPARPVCSSVLHESLTRPPAGPDTLLVCGRIALSCATTESGLPQKLPLSRGPVSAARLRDLAEETPPGAPRAVPVCR